MTRTRIAVVGSGAAGLGAAWALRDVAEVVLYEVDARLGGHANTVDIDHGGAPVRVDTGFIVFNDGNYPNLCAFFDHLGVDSVDTTMSFGFQGADGVEWSSNLDGFFAQKRNFARPSHLGMLRDILRFNAAAQRDLDADALEGLTLGDYLNRLGLGRAIRTRYLAPMGAAIWSAQGRSILDQPALTFVRFFNNHRLLHAKRRQWRTVVGGSRSYVERVGEALAGRVRLSRPVTAITRDALGVTVRDSRGHADRFDEVILACHADQALAMLTDPTPDERDLLGAFTFSANTAVLHRDASLMPKARKAWAAWNYRDQPGDGPVSVTYDMNALQHIRADKPTFVTLNPQPGEIASNAMFGAWEYDHPQLTTAATAAQRVFNRVQGPRRTWFAGAWLGYGFHEDALRAGLRVALRLGGRIPWAFAEGDVSGGPWGAREASVPAQAAAG